jgi:2-polyprenyl-3-methyl-5-hydroxy-6-metoxy-1,4-benzoquinol methylase
MSGPCLVCAAAGSRSKLAVGGYSIVKCISCGFEWVDPRPSAEQLSTFYGDERYFAGCEAGYADYEAEEPGHRRLARRRLAWMERRLPSGRLVDLGCGPGFFVDEAARRGWSAWGAEISAPMRHRAAARGLRVLAADDERGLAELTPLDAVTMWEYVEHVLDPAAELSRAAGLLRPGGVLALSTPNVAHRLASSDPARWPEYKPPAHLSFFDATTLSRLLERAGFDRIEVRYAVPSLGGGGTASRVVDRLGRALGTGRDRRTSLWWLYSAAYRLHAAPAWTAAAFAPARYSLGLEVLARRR